MHSFWRPKEKIRGTHFLLIEKQCLPLLSDGLDSGIFRICCYACRSDVPILPFIPDFLPVSGNYTHLLGCFSTRSDLTPNLCDLVKGHLGSLCINVSFCFLLETWWCTILTVRKPSSVCTLHLEVEVAPLSLLPSRNFFGFLTACGKQLHKRQPTCRAAFRSPERFGCKWSADSKAVVGGTEPTWVLLKWWGSLRNPTLLCTVCGMVTFGD